MTSESDTLARLLAYHDHIEVPPLAIEEDVRRGRRRVRRNRALVSGAAALAVASVVLATSLLSGTGQDPEPQPLEPVPTPTGATTPAPHTGPVRDGSSWPVLKARRTGVDPRLGMGSSPLAWADDSGDTPAGLVDIRYVASMNRSDDKDHPFLGEWRMSLAEGWPGRSKIGPSDGVVEYGIVVDTDGDRVADCQIGINDDAPQVHDYGDYRVWVKNLRTGKTAEKVGGPYGMPIDFVLPDESGGHYVSFFFLTHGQPCDFRGAIHYYAYASATGVDGQVTRDFAPDGAWLSGSPGQS